MPKINPGSNVHGDNDTRTSRLGCLHDIDIPEPKQAEKGMLQCTLCNAMFSSEKTTSATRSQSTSHYA